MRNGLRFIGSAFTLAEAVQSFSASQSGGVLAYWTGAGTNEPQVVWFDRKGNRIGSLGEPVRQSDIRISPDGTKVAAEIYDAEMSGIDSDIWLYDVLARSQNTVDIWSRNRTNAMLVTRRENTLSSAQTGKGTLASTKSDRWGRG